MVLPIEQRDVAIDLNQPVPGPTTNLLNLTHTTFVRLFPCFKQLRRIRLPLLIDQRMMVPAHEYEIVGRISLSGGEARFAARSVVRGRVNVANLPDHSSIRKRRSGRDDGIGASGESASVSRGSGRMEPGPIPALLTRMSMRRNRARVDLVISSPRSRWLDPFRR